MKKILYISGSRSDYGLIRSTLLLIKEHPRLNVEIVATGMHLMGDFGNTLKEINKEGLKVHLIKAIYKRDNRESVVEFLGNLILGLLKEIKRINPNMVFIQGDRPEMLGAAIASTYLNIPIIHSHGGEKTSTVDEIARHAITKLSHIHLVATKKAAKRIERLGEEKWRIFVVGAPGLDDIADNRLLSNREIARKYKLDSSKPILILLYHPVGSIQETSFQIKEVMEAIKELKYQTIAIYPNADPGGRAIIKVINSYNRKLDFIRIYKNIPRKEYLSLMKIASALVGNSSSGIIEAPSFRLPFVNIGERQEGRERSNNVVDVDCDSTKIKSAIEKAIYNKSFKEKVRKSKNPYGDGNAGKRIVNILDKIKIDRRLLQKKITY